MQSSLEEKETLTKGPCHDCKMCQNCSESRCRLCLNVKSANKKVKLSFDEQIELYNRLNPGMCRISE
ncbi:MAG: hypothetical protein ACYDHG_18115 [Desulfomonilaceae bacterium]